VANLFEIRPAAIQVGIRLEPGQRFGFYNFRHPLRPFLSTRGKDVKTIQGLLRHAKATTMRTPGRLMHGGEEDRLGAQQQTEESAHEDLDKSLDQRCGVCTWGWGMGSGRSGHSARQN
jgi:hypothetical protein